MNLRNLQHNHKRQFIKTTMAQPTAARSSSATAWGTVLQENHWSCVLCLVLAYTALKILLFPAYRSTDFDVHLHWKSLTWHLNHTRQWYFDDEYVETIHTLDYPPSFAYLEWFWSNNPLTRWLLRNEFLDSACLALKPSIPRHEPSVACVAFMRSTVLVSESVYWLACYVWACLVAPPSTNSPKPSNHDHPFSWRLFLLLALNPAILWLDHVHFQYNGFLLGLLMLSLACLWLGLDTSRKSSSLLWNLLGAVLYATLLTFKHLYLTLALWYFAYLLRKFCFVANSSSKKEPMNSFSIRRFLLLGTVTVTTILVPFAPFLKSTQLQRIFQRLFPFQRGLVHDYWAGNVWAILMAAQKIVKALPNDVPPRFVAGILVTSLLPGCGSAWKSAALPAKSHKVTAKARLQMVEGFTYSALASFMTGYHVHEKAIVHTLLPLSILAVAEYHDREKRTADSAPTGKRLLLFRTQAFALTGLLPLLYPATELLMKLTSLIAYLSMVCHFLQPSVHISTWKHGNPLSLVFSPRQQVWGVTAIISATVTLLEFVPLSVFGKYEFLPLALTSVTVACGLIWTFAELLWGVLLGPRSVLRKAQKIE